MITSKLFRIIVFKIITEFGAGCLSNNFKSFGALPLFCGRQISKRRSESPLLWKHFVYFHFLTCFFQVHVKVFSIFDTGMPRQYQQNQLEIIDQLSWTKKVFKNCQKLKKNRSPKFDWFFMLSPKGIWRLRPQHCGVSKL